MARLLAAAGALFVAALAGAALALWLRAPREKLPDPPALVTQMREVARLETLEVTLYKKVSFEQDPAPPSSFWADVARWIAYSVRPPRGKAIVFAVAHLGLDFDKLSPRSVRVAGKRVDAVLPPIRVQVELRPADTEVIGSNLDSAQTAQLFEKARAAFEAEVAADEALKSRARASAERALRGLILGLGFSEVNFVDALPAGGA